MGRLLIALAAFLLLPSPALAQWAAVESAHFVIFSESAPAEVEKLAERLESYDKLMRMATGIAENVEPVKVRIYEVQSTEDIEAALGLSNTRIAGFYDSNILGPFLVTPRRLPPDTPGFSRELVLHHEYAHHFMLQYFPAIYPGWYVEGFAELIASSKPLDGGRIGYGMPARHRGKYIAANWIPLQELLVKEKMVYLDTYGQGWALAHFFTFNKARANQFRQYLLAISAGKSLKEAAQLFGDLGELNREARRYVTSGTFAYTPVKVEIRRPVIHKRRPLSAAEAALIPEVIAFQNDELSMIRKAGDRERERKRREANLRRIRDKLARFGNDPFALYLLAEAEAAAGNFAQSEAAADRLLALQPSHGGGLVRRSLLFSQAAARLRGPERAAKAAQARRLASKANAADINDPLPLVAYYQSFRMAGEKVPAKAVEGLRQAVSMLPRETTIRQFLIDQLAAEGQFAEAIAWLLPIANSSHASPRREAAREQMVRLQAGLANQQGTVPPAATPNPDSSGR